MRRSATISTCGKYRFQLLREWDTTLPKVLFIMLNPSKADADIDDPTITRCIGFAKLWGYGGLMVGNLWAYRATEPKELKESPEVIGEFAEKLQSINNAHITAMGNQCELVIFAWGTHGFATDERTQYMMGKYPNGMAITISKHGKPVHPLYLRKTLTPIRYVKGVVVIKKRGAYRLNEE